MMSFQNAATWESPHLEDGLALFWYGKILIEQQRHQEVQILGAMGAMVPSLRTWRKWIENGPLRARFSDSSGKRELNKRGYHRQFLHSYGSSGV